MDGRTYLGKTSEANLLAHIWWKWHWKQKVKKETTVMERKKNQQAEK